MVCEIGNIPVLCKLLALGHMSSSNASIQIHLQNLLCVLKASYDQLKVIREAKCLIQNLEEFLNLICAYMVIYGTGRM